jgi:hypothetical protein
LGNWCSRKVFHTAVPTLASDFSLRGLASLPVALPGLSLYGLLRSIPRAEARETIESVAVRRRASTSGSEQFERSWVGGAPPV